MLFLLAAILFISFSKEIKAENVNRDGAKSFNGHCYKIMDSYYTWSQAKEECEKAGGHLVTITSAKEQNFIEKLIKKNGKRYMYWIGATCEGHVGKWSWVTDEEFQYTNWAVLESGKIKEPDNWGGISYYATIINVDDTRWVNKRFTWGDYTQIGYISSDISGYWGKKEDFGFICEWDFDNGTSDASQGNTGKPKIVLSASKVTLKTGQSKTLKVKVFGTKKKVKWSSSNKRVASINNKGKITAKKTGKTKIRASVKGVSAVCSVTVK